MTQTIGMNTKMYDSPLVSFIKVDYYLNSAESGNLQKKLNKTKHLGFD